jgi:hypothetical protein
VRGLSHFHETNIRTYVRYRGTHPGVWFFSLDAANEIAVQIARSVWKLPYYFAEMSLTGDGDTLVYRSRRLRPAPVPADCHIRVVPLGHPQAAQCRTLEHFLVERYTLYSAMNGKLFRGRVHHEPYLLQTATLEHCTETLTARAGFDLQGPPSLVHYVTGVEVEVFSLTAIR